MRRKLPPFVECWRDRHGKLRVYFRKARGRRIALPAAIGSDEFDSGYRAALAGELTPGREKHAMPAPRTIAALVLSYMRSAAYLGLRETTKVGYAARIETLRAKHGHRSVAGLTRHELSQLSFNPTPRGRVRRSGF
jgi:enterobacteria phage integrase